jgi:CHAT domain-containing protein
LSVSRVVATEMALRRCTTKFLATASAPTGDTEAQDQSGTVAGAEVDIVADEAQARIGEIANALRLKDDVAAGVAGDRLELLLPALCDPIRDPLLAALLELAALKIVTEHGQFAAADLLAKAHEMIDGNAGIVPSARAMLAELEARRLKFAGKWEEALPLYELAIDQLMPFKDDPLLAQQLVIYQSNKADAEEKAGHLVDAIAGYEAAMQLAADALTKSAILSDLGRGLASFGRYREAAARHSESLGIRQTIEGSDALVAESRALLASALADAGDYRGADMAFASAIRSYEDLPGHSAEHVGVLLNFCVYKLDHRLLPAVEDALRMAQSMLGSGVQVPIDVHIQVAEIIATIARQRGDAGTAIGGLRDAVAQLASVNAGHPALAILRRELADAYLVAGDTTNASTLIDSTLAGLNATADNLLPRAALIGTRSAILHGEGHFDEAVADARNALEMVRGRVGSSNPVIADLRDNLVFPLAASGKTAEALIQAEAAESIRDEDLDALFSSQTESERLRTLDDVRSGLDAFLTLALTAAASDSDAAVGGRNVVARAFELVLRRQAIVAESTALALTPPVQDRDAAMRATRLRWVRAEMGRQILSASPDKGAIDKLRAERNELEFGLAGVFALVGFVQRMRTATAAAVAVALPQNAVLIDFLVHRPIDFTAPAWATDRSAAAHYVAFVLRGGSTDDLVVEDLGPCAEIDQAIDEWRRLIETKDSRVDAAADPVARRVLEPLRPHLENVDHLVIVPDGALARVPFAALPFGNGLLIDECIVSLADSGRDILSWSRPSVDRPGPAYIAGGIEYDPKPNGEAVEIARPPLPFRIPPFGPLSGTLAEVRPIAALYGVAAETASQPREGRLKALVSPSIVHLATHGYFLPLSLAESVPSSMLRAGVVLVGFNRALAGRPAIVGMQDGALTAEDVLELNLASTELVVLSACETGLGDVQACEGVFGLRRSFAIAGVDALVMSLWNVPDSATATLMIAFHQRLKNGEAAATALGNAMVDVRRTSTHTHDWAAFVLAGRPGPITSLRPQSAEQSASR